MNPTKAFSDWPRGTYLLTGWRRPIIVTLNVAVLLGSCALIVVGAVRQVRDNSRPVAFRTLEYRTWTDPDTRASVSIPSSFVEVPTGQTADATAFASTDGQGRVTMWTAKTSPTLTPTDALDRCQSDMTKAGGNVTFTYSSDRFYVCRGVEPLGATFYERGVIGTNRSYWFRWEYSPRWRNVYEPAVQKAVDSFSPGPLNVISE